MRFKQYLNEEDADGEMDGSLLGMRLRNGPANGIGYSSSTVTVDTPNQTWNTFPCDNFELTSLEYSPKIVIGTFDASENKLTSLKGAPRECGAFNVRKNHIKNLIGSPTTVFGLFDVRHNQLTSLEGAPTMTGDFYVASNRLTSLHNVHKQVKQVNGSFWFGDNPIKECILGLLLIPGLQSIGTNIVPVRLRQAVDILNRYLKESNMYKRDMSDVSRCQDELIEAGLDEFAEL